MRAKKSHLESFTCTHKTTHKTALEFWVEQQTYLPYLSCFQRGKANKQDGAQKLALKIGILAFLRAPSPSQEQHTSLALMWSPRPDRQPGTQRTELLLVLGRNGERGRPNFLLWASSRFHFLQGYPQCLKCSVIYPYKPVMMGSTRIDLLSPHIPRVCLS